MLGLGKELSDPGVLDHRREAIRAEQEHVAGPGAARERVDLDVGLRSERAGDDRALRMILGLLLGELALATQLLDQRMIGREEGQLSVAPEVGATVADVGEGDIVVMDEGGGERGPHARPRGVVLGEAVDPLVGRLRDPAQERLCRLGSGALGLLERLGGDARRDLAGLGAAHPVGHDEQRGAGEVGVLVRRPLASGVRAEGLLAHADHQPPPAPGTSSSKRNSVSPILTESRSCSSASPRSCEPLRNVPLVEFMSST